MQTLSLCMIVKDEARNLPRSLAPLMPFVDEAVVADTGSTDGTPELAASLGARVCHVTWSHDFAGARNFSLAQAAGDWVMWLDGDNRVAPEDAPLLKSLVQRPGDAILWATEILEPGGGRLLQKRIFPRRPEIGFRYRVHEQLCHPPDLTQVVTPVRIFHWGYEDRSLRQAKARRNLAYLLADLKERPYDFYLRYHLTRHHFFAGELDEAWGQLQAVLATPELGAQNPEIARHARLMAGLMRDRGHDPAGALEQFRELLTDYPDYGLAWYHLGLTCFRVHDFPMAALALARFLELGCGHFLLDQPEEKLVLTALLTRAQALRQLRRYQETAAVLARARQLYPRQEGVWLETAALARACRDYTCARRALAACLNLRPQSRRARTLLREMEDLDGHLGNQS
jgi:glycosyltransferase involved in cell wall biosynthesis